MDNNLYLSNSVASNLPSMVKNELAKMSAQKQEEFLEEFKRKEKSLAVGYLLWLFFGFHYIYFKKIGTQILFTCTLGGFFFWWLADAFRIPSIIKDMNKDNALEIMRNLKTISS